MRCGLFGMARPASTRQEQTWEDDVVCVSLISYRRQYQINLLNGRVDTVIFALETKKFSLMSTKSSLRQSCASTKSTVTTFQAPLTRAVSEGTQNAVSVVNGSTEMTSCMRIVVTDMNDATSATDDLDIASSSTTSTITPSKTTSKKATSFAWTGNAWRRSSLCLSLRWT